MPARTENIADAVHRYFREQYPGLVRNWFRGLNLAPARRGEVIITAASPDQVQYLGTYCTRAFVAAVQSATGRLLGVRFVGPGGEPYHLPAPPPAEEDADDAILRLHPDYTFDEFVTGPSNRLAHSAAAAVSQDPGQTYNPFFVHGNSGLGKTHLQHAICHRVLDERPGLKVAYLPCEAFINLFISAVTRGTLHEFRHRYRQMDILVLDDVQFLALRERSQEEFFHTFNTLYQDHRQIILSADCPPDRIPGLEPRLISRFNWGLVAPIEPPCTETRVAIIRRKAAARRLEVSDDVVMLVAERVSSNARELEGALCRLQNAAETNGGRLDPETAHRALGAPLSPPAALRVDDIIESVTRRFGIKAAELQGRRRHKSVALPRHVCMHLARRLTQHSLDEIGEYFGGRDHTTVLYADRMIGQRRSRDPALAATLDALEGELRRRT